MNSWKEGRNGLYINMHDPLEHYMTSITIAFCLGSGVSSHFNDCVRNFYETKKKLFIDLNEFIY